MFKIFYTYSDFRAIKISGQNFAIFLEEFVVHLLMISEMLMFKNAAGLLFWSVEQMNTKFW